MEYQLTLNWPNFLEHHWQKCSVLLKRGFTNFVDSVSPDELVGLAMESETDSHLISHQDGKWQISHGPFESYNHLSESISMMCLLSKVPVAATGAWEKSCKCTNTAHIPTFCRSIHST